MIEFKISISDLVFITIHPNKIRVHKMGTLYFRFNLIVLLSNLPAHQMDKQILGNIIKHQFAIPMNSKRSTTGNFTIL